jgi:hypothetical protein
MDSTGGRARFTEGAGGTPGGCGTFLLGLVLAVAGGYLLLNQVQVTSSGGFTFWGMDAFGLSLVPFLLGVALVFFDGRSWIGWLLIVCGAVIILAGVLTRLDIYFRTTSLFNTLLMLGLLFGGIGLLARAVRGGPPRS